MPASAQPRHTGHRGTGAAGGATGKVGGRVAGKVGVVGQGHVGLRLALAAAGAGFDVAGFDTDTSLIKELQALGAPAQLAAGQAGVSLRAARSVSPALDGVDAALVSSALASGRYRPTSDEADLQGFDVGLVAVPTPVSDDGTPSTEALLAAAASLGRHLRRGAAVSVESTLYPGATAGVVAPALEAASGLVAGRDFRLGYSPERIDTGNAGSAAGAAGASGALGSLASTPKLVSGIDSRSLAVLSAFYHKLVDEVVEVEGMAEAELAKLIENTFRQVNVALANEIAVAAGAMGLDAAAAFDAAATKPFGYMAFRPGPGPGGRCLAGAAGHLAWAAQRAGHPLRLVEAAGQVNASMPRRVVARVEEELAAAGSALDGAAVLVLGLSYKPGVGETKGSAALEVANTLASLGADVLAADPHVGDCPGLDPRARRVDASPEPLAEAAAAADMVVLLVDHAGFDLRRIVEGARAVMDTRCRVSGPNVVRL